MSSKIYKIIFFVEYEYEYNNMGLPAYRYTPSTRQGTNR
jgi:hypothetical protein